MASEEQINKIDTLIGELIAVEGYDSINDQSVSKCLLKEFTQEEVDNLSEVWKQRAEILVEHAAETHLITEDPFDNDESDGEEYTEGGAGSAKHKFDDSESDSDSDEVAAPRVKSEDDNVSEPSAAKKARKPKVDADYSLLAGMDIQPEPIVYTEEGAPKKPLSSYMLFVKENRSIVKQNNPGVSEKQVVGLLGAAWNSLDRTQHAMYSMRAKLSLDAYNEAMKQLEETNPVLFVSLQERKKKRTSKKDKVKVERVKKEPSATATTRRRREVSSSGGDDQATLTAYEDETTKVSALNKLSSEAIAALEMPTLVDVMDESALNQLTTYERMMKKDEMEKRMLRGFKKGTAEHRTIVLKQVVNIINNMLVASNEDALAIANQKPALSKLQILNKTVTSLLNKELHEDLLERGVLEAIVHWLNPEAIAEGTLPLEKVRSEMYRVLGNLEPTEQQIASSGIGKVIMMLWKHPNETPKNKKTLSSLIERWCRLVIHSNTSYRSLSKSVNAEQELRKSQAYTDLLRKPQYIPPTEKHRILFPQAVATNFYIQPGSKQSHRDEDGDDYDTGIGGGDEAMEVHERKPRKSKNPAASAANDVLRSVSNIKKTYTKSSFLSGPNINSHKY